MALDTPPWRDQSSKGGWRGREADAAEDIVGKPAGRRKRAFRDNPEPLDRERIAHAQVPSARRQQAVARFPIATCAGPRRQGRQIQRFHGHEGPSFPWFEAGRYVVPVIAIGHCHSKPFTQRDNIRVDTRIDLAAGAWVEYVPGWVESTEADRLLAAVRGELAWEHREIVLFGRRVPQPRLIAWAGSLRYRYSGQTLEPRAPTPTIAAIIARMSERTGVSFNHVLLNRYRDGSDSIGLHADDEPELGLDPIVATLSLGATRRFVLKPRRTRLGPTRSVELHHGSLLVMGGTCQRHYVHGVARQSDVAGERISLTFRRLLRAP